MRPLTLLILAAASGWAAEEANGIIKRLTEAQKQNDSLAGEYTYAAETAYFTFSLFLFHGIALWTSLLGPRRGNYNQSFGNDLSFAGNIVVIGGMLSLLFLPQLVAKQWPGALT